MGQSAIIVRRYARGLAERAQETGEIDEVRSELGIVADILDPRAGKAYIPEFLAYLQNPTAGHAEKIAESRKLLEQSGIGKTVINFFCLLIQHGRVELLPRINTAYDAYSAVLTGEYTATVETARPLTEDQSHRLTSVLASALGGVVRLRQLVDPNLLAGARVSIGDKTIDGTVLGKLDKLRQRLAYGAWEEEPASEPEGA